MSEERSAKCTKKKSHSPLDLDALQAENIGRIDKHIEAQAKGETIDAEQLRQDLACAGLSLSDFSKLVALVSERMEAAEKINRAEVRKPELADLGQKLEKLNLEIKALREKYESELKVLNDAWQTLSDRQSSMQWEVIADRSSGTITLEKTANPQVKNELKLLGVQCQHLEINLRKYDSLGIVQKKKNEDQQALEDRRAASAREQAKVFRLKLESKKARAEELRKLIADPVKGFSYEAVLANKTKKPQSIRPGQMTPAEMF